LPGGEEAGTFEGLSAADNSVEEHSEGPDVGVVAKVGPLGQDLGAHVAGRAAEVGQLHVSRGVGEAEVDQLDAQVLGDQHVAQLYVSMGYALGVQMVEAEAEVADDDAGVPFLDAFLGLALEVLLETDVVEFLHEEVDLVKRPRVRSLWSRSSG
jgi:hypothetical protein